ncbi:hypothetical protein ABPG72_016012 [Tetrahymena utriculariae]
MSIQCMSSNSSLDFQSSFGQPDLSSLAFSGSATRKQNTKKIIKQVQEDYSIEKNPSTDCSSDSSDQAMKPKTDETKYKTEMCKNFQATGTCNYGKKCKFAHGKQDLVSKPIQNSKSYKTKTCKAFHEELNCPYGSRCHFKHDQRSIQEIQQSKYYSKKLATLEFDLSEMENCNLKVNHGTRLPFFMSMIQNN